MPSPQKKGGNQHQAQQGSENEQMLLIIQEAFRNCSQHGQLSLDKFNQALSILEALGFKRIRDTPLADRLFHIFDTVNLIRTSPIREPSKRISSLRVSLTFLETTKMQSNVRLS